jgi:hypothetical protein
LPEKRRKEERINNPKQEVCMVGDTGIVNAIDSFVASLEEEQVNEKLIEDNSNTKKPEMSEDNSLEGIILR